MKVFCLLNNAPPQARIGGMIATHQFLRGLVEAGHDLKAIIEQPNADYLFEGVHYQSEDPFTALYIADCDVVLSNNGGTGHGHLAAVHGGKPSVKFVHGAAPGFVNQLHEWRDPDLAVFNSKSLLKLSGYTSESLVCPPPINVEEWETTRGDCITLVNLTDEKGAHTFDQIARHLPDHRFLAVQGGYGVQAPLWRHNMKVIPPTWYMRDDVYARTRILLMPGLLETWGMVGLEAMCSGIPVIAHPALGPKEAMGTDAMYADRDDLDAWIDLIEALDDPKVYAKWSMKALRRAHKHAATDPVGDFVRTMERLFG